MDSTQRVRAMLSFVQAADQGSFVAAARRLGLTAAAVGKNVAGLEAALGVRLMNRSTRSLQLTTEGLAFLEAAREAINALDAAIEGVAARRTEIAGPVRISASFAFGSRYLMPLLPELARLYPDIVPDIVFDDRRVDVVRDGFDLALRGGTIPDSSLISRRICHFPMILVASPSYISSHGTPGHPDDLPRHKLIALRFHSGLVASWDFRALEGGNTEWLPQPVALTVSEPETAMEAAVYGLGITQTAVHHAWPHLREGRLKIVLRDHHLAGTREMVVQYPHRALVAPRVRATVDFLLSSFAGNEALHVQRDDLAAFCC
jgi:DNA-binding transcriptional LysR family regulator